MTFNSLKNGYPNVFCPPSEATKKSNKTFRITPSSYFAAVTPDVRKLKDPDRLVLYAEIEGEGLHMDLDEDKFLLAIKNFGFYRMEKQGEVSITSAPFIEGWNNDRFGRGARNSVSIANCSEIPQSESIPRQEVQNRSLNNLPARTGKSPATGNPGFFHQRSPSEYVSQTALKIKKKLQVRLQKEQSVSGVSGLGRQFSCLAPERQSISVSCMGEQLRDNAHDQIPSRGTMPQINPFQHVRNSSDTGTSLRASKKSSGVKTARVHLQKFSFKQIMFDLESPVPLQDFLCMLPGGKQKCSDLQRELFVGLVKQTRPVLPSESSTQQMSVWKDFTRERGYHIFLELSRCVLLSPEDANQNPSQLLLHLLKQYIIQQSFAVLNSNCSSPKVVGGNSSFKRKNNLLLSFASIEDTIGSIYEKRKLRRRDNLSGIGIQNPGLQRVTVRAGPSIAVAGVGGALINPSSSSPRSKLNCGNDSEFGLNEILESVLIGVFTCILNDPRKIEAFYSTSGHQNQSQLQLEYGSLIEKSLKFISKECALSLGQHPDSLAPEDIRNKLKSLEEITQFRALETFKISGDISILVSLLFSTKQPDFGQFVNTADKSSRAVRSNYKFPESGHSAGESPVKTSQSSDAREGTPRSLAERDFEPLKHQMFENPGSGSEQFKQENPFEKKSTHRQQILHVPQSRPKIPSGALEKLPLNQQSLQPPENLVHLEHSDPLDPKKFQSNGDFGRLYQPHTAGNIASGKGFFNSKGGNGLGGSPREQDKISQVVANSLEMMERSLGVQEGDKIRDSQRTERQPQVASGPYQSNKTPQPTMPALQPYEAKKDSSKKFPSMNFAGASADKKPKQNFVPVGHTIIKPKKEEYSSGRELLRKGKNSAARLMVIPTVSVHQQKRKESDEIQLDDMEEEVYACHFDEKWHVLRNDLKDSFLLRARYEEVVQDPNLHTQILMLIKDEVPRIIQNLVKLHLAKSDGRELAIAVFKEQHKIDAGIAGEHSYRSRSNLDFHYEVFKTLLSQFASFKLIAFTKRLKLLFIHEDKFVLGAYEAAVHGLFLSNFSKPKRDSFLKEFGENLELMVDLMEEEKNPGRFAMLTHRQRAIVWNTTKDEEEALCDLEEKLTPEQIHGLKKYIYFNNSGTLHNQYYKYRRQKFSLDELLIRLDSLSHLYVYRRG